MMNKEILKEIIVANENFINNEVGTILERESIFSLPKLNKVTVFYGVRRSGKTFVLFDIFKRHKDFALYIDFEDERLIGFEAKDFQKLKEAFLELKPALIGRELFFLFDEIQNI